MLKHKDIIDKLTAEQKIALLTDTREELGKEVEAMNIPAPSLGQLWDENMLQSREAVFPSAKSLANSWDEELFGDVARCLAHMGAVRGDNLFLLPSSNASASAYGPELSEEPYLAGALVAGMAKKLKSSQIPYCLSAPVCLPDSARYLDKEADRAVVFDRIARPFRMVEGVGGAQAVLLNNTTVDGSYGDANKEIFEKVVPKSLEQMVKIEDGDMTSSALTSGKQLIGGSALVISTALKNYNRIYRSMEEGGATAQELQMTVADGAAISEDMIDEALDRKLTLAYACARGFVPVAESDLQNQAYKAASESIVLVKNEKALPLGKKEKLTLVGDIINDGDECGYKGFVNKLKNAMGGGANISGTAKGYLLSENVSDDMIEPACKAAESASTAVVFVGLGLARESKLNDTARLSLPGNQIALLTKLRKSVKKLVVVVCGERLPDMSFDHLADAILLIPSQGAYVAEALWDILRGEVSPSGKLAYAGAAGIDMSFREVQKRKRLGLQKIGPFVAYRYTDGNGEDTPYPVGFGLSYTSFTYSKLHVDKTGKLSFAVKNTGKIDSCEVVQVYLSKRSPSTIRPVKELRGAIKVRLKSGEKKTVSIPLSELDIYDEGKGAFLIEKGVYDVQIGASATDIRLTGKISLNGDELTKEEKRLSDYLQNVSNITSESYTMEAYCKPMNIKSKLKSFGAIMLIATLFADVVYAISCLMLEIDFKDKLYLTIFLIINAACLAIAIISMIVGGAKIRKIKKRIEKQETEATKELFRTVKPTDAKAIDELFEDEFDVSLESQNTQEVTYNDKDASTYAYMAVDTDIPTLCKELESHFAEYGLAIAPKMARRILSAVMTSRLIVMRSNTGVTLSRFVEILAHFFGTEPHVEFLKGEAWSRKSLLRYNKAEGESSARPAPLTPAISTAFNEGDKACFFGLAEARFSDLGDILMPYVQYFGNPEIEQTVFDESGSIIMPSNLWFVVSPARGQSLDDMPAFIANLATLVDVETQPVQEAATKTVRKHTTCHQLDALIFRAKKAAVISEDIWKGVDSLEGFVNEKTPYHIGNKLFLQLEKYMAIYNTCEADLHEAMDCAVAGKLLPGILNMLKGNEAMRDSNLAEYVENVFGEDYAVNCRNVIKRLVINKPTDTLDKPAEKQPVATATLNQPVATATVNEPVATATLNQPVATATVNEPVAKPINEEKGAGFMGGFGFGGTQMNTVKPLDEKNIEEAKKAEPYVEPVVAEAVVAEPYVEPVVAEPELVTEVKAVADPLEDASDKENTQNNDSATVNEDTEKKASVSDDDLFASMMGFMSSSNDFMKPKPQGDDDNAK